MTNLHGMSPEWFTPERCTWHVQSEFVNDESFLAVYPLEHMGMAITQEQADWVRAQLNRSSEPGYFGFNIKSPQYAAFVDQVSEKVYGHPPTDDEYETMSHIIFGSMAQMFWE